MREGLDTGTSESELVESIYDVEAFLDTPGRYHTTTGHQAYAVLQALAWDPLVQIDEELFFPEGSILHVTVLDEPRPARDESDELEPNIEKVSWGTETGYFENRLRDYDSWESAFWRECIQNSRDAGATRIDMEVREDTFVDPETGDRVPAVRVSISDNGRGMDKETLLSAFFRRGGTKKAEGAIGGFGDAKNLILTPWLGYEVYTRDVIARGRHEDLFLPILEGQKRIDGTRVTVWMPPTKTTTVQHAQNIIESSSLKQIRFAVNGQSVGGEIPEGTLVRSKPVYPVVWERGEYRIDTARRLGELRIFHAPRARRARGVFVRSYGLYTYTVPGYETSDVKGVVTVEINAPPVLVFNAKRTGLAATSTAAGDVGAFLKELASEARGVLKSERDKKISLYEGAGAIQVREGIASKLAADVLSKVDLSEKAKVAKENGETIALDRREIEILLGAVKQAVVEQDKTEGPAVETAKPLPQAFGIALSQIEFVDTEQIAGAVRLALWKPDFLLYQNISPFKVPKNLEPKDMALKYHQLLQVWTDVCKFLLVQLGMFRSFGVGWVLDTEYDPEKGETVIAAAYSNFKQRDWLLLNPVDIAVSGYGENRDFKVTGDRYDLKKPKHVEKIIGAALHEITHMQGISKHTDAYASALTKNIHAAVRVGPVLDQIVQASLASVREVREAQEAARPVVRFEEVRQSGTPDGVIRAYAHDVATGEKLGEIELIHDYQPVYTYRWHDETGYERAKTVTGYDKAKQGLLRALDAVEEGGGRRRTSRREDPLARLRPDGLGDDRFRQLWALYVVARMGAPSLQGAQFGRLGYTYGQGLAIGGGDVGGRLLDSLDRELEHRGAVSGSAGSQRELASGGISAWSSFVDAASKGNTSARESLQDAMLRRGGLERLLNAVAGAYDLSALAMAHRGA